LKQLSAINGEEGIMISYKTYKLINESLGGPMALGLTPRHSIGVAGSRLSEMGLRPDEIDQEEDEMDGMGEEGPDSENAPFPPHDMGDEEGMEDEMGDDMGDDMDDEMGMDDEESMDMGGQPEDELGHLPFNKSQMADMHSLAGLDDEEGMGDDMGADPMGGMGDDMGMDDEEGMDDMGDDMDDEMGMDDEEGMDDMGDDMDDIDSMDDEMGMSSRPKFDKLRSFGKNESKVCDEEDKDDKKSNASDIMKYKKKSKKEENEEYVGRRGHKEVKESFWADFMKNAAGNRKMAFKEDAIIPPTNPNTGLGDVGNVGHAPQGRVGGVGSNDGEVKNDFFGYHSVNVPSFHDFIESKKNA
jgi:hypothetical protein